MHFVENFSEGDKDSQIEAMRTYFDFTSAEDAEVIYCASIEKLGAAMSAYLSHKKPLVTYCWDYYKWVHHTDYGGFHWDKYIDFMRHCDLILVPSRAQQRRLKELLNFDSEVVRTGVTVYDHPVSDKGYILDPLRYYPEENRDWAVKAAATLNIPIIHTEHGYSSEEFRKMVAECTFMTSCVREASTGALTLIEGLNLGKVSLVSNSPYQGAVDYVGDHGYYFQYDDFDELVSVMEKMWKARPKVEKKKAQKYVKDNFSYELMAENIYDKIITHCHL